MTICPNRLPGAHWPRHALRVALLDDDQHARLSSFHADGPEWIDRLPRVVDDYAARWRLEIGPTFRPGGDSSWAARVTCADGTPAVLKVSFADETERHAVSLLRLLDGAGAVRLLDHDPDDHVSLLELCEPGTWAALEPVRETDNAAAAVLPTHWQASPTLLPNLPRLSEIAQQQADMLRSRAAQFGDQLLYDAADLQTAMAANTAHTHVLHGDANQRNVLRSRRGWLAIDPRPVLGDPCYDLAAWTTNRIDEVDRPVDRVVTLARRLGLAEDRALAWVATQTALLCSWLQRSGESGVLQVYRAATTDILVALDRLT